MGLWETEGWRMEVGKILESNPQRVKEIIDSKTFEKCPNKPIYHVAHRKIIRFC